MQKKLRGVTLNQTPQALEHNITKQNGLRLVGSCVTATFRLYLIKSLHTLGLNVPTNLFFILVSHKHGRCHRLYCAFSGHSAVYGGCSSHWVYWF
jgi:hypothetical protein